MSTSQPIAEIALQPERDAVLYDGSCPMCTFQMRLLTQLDWSDRFEMVPLADPKVKEIAPNLQRSDLMNAMHVVTRGSNVYRGAYAIRYISARLPLLWPLCVLLWIPGVSLLAVGIYALVSRNRYLISKLFGCKSACGILPEKTKKTG